MKTLSSGKEALQRLLASFPVVPFLLSSARGQTATPLRRPISLNQPLWLIPTRAWKWPDSQIPSDIRPGQAGSGGGLNFTLPIKPGSERRSFYPLLIFQP